VWVCVMKIITWNVRGLGRLDKRKEVGKLVREKNTFIVCLQETKL
jgi:exonuclease III